MSAAHTILHTNGALRYDRWRAYEEPALLEMRGWERPNPDPIYADNVLDPAAMAAALSRSLSSVNGKLAQMRRLLPQEERRLRMPSRYRFNPLSFEESLPICQQIVQRHKQRLAA